MTYLVRVRNTPDQQRNTWGAYVKALRDATGMSRAELARRLEVDSSTVWRWETGKQKPESPAIPQSIATLFQIDLDEVLAAAGLKPDVEAPAEPTRERDEDLEDILNSGLPRALQQELIAGLEERRARDRAQQRADLRRMIRIAGGKAS